jgi:hypothetical protein
VDVDILWNVKMFLFVVIRINNILLFK